MPRIRVAVGAIAVALVVTGCQSTGPDQPPASSPPATAGQWTMPNLVGTNLQEAQNRIQALTGGAIFFTDSHDATDQHRNQVLDADWKVCAQNVPAGAPITADTKIDFGAVKLTETCP